MQIVEYSQNRWGASVATLFAAIYPDLSEAECDKLAYDEKVPLHQLTLLAVHGGIPIGQINVFRVGEGAELGNVGYHVHPDWRRKGIASLLLCEAWPRIVGVFADGLVIQTNERNTGSIGLALKAGFVAATPELVARYRHRLKFATHSDGLCFHLSRTHHEPTNALQQAAIGSAAL